MHSFSEEMNASTSTLYDIVCKIEEEARGSKFAGSATPTRRQK
jgi:hypothetical protein